MKTLKDEPYLAVLLLCAVGAVAIIIFEHLDVIFALLGGGIVLYVTLILPVAVVFIAIKLLYKLFGGK